MNPSLKTVTITFSLDSSSVQSDLANYAELVFDFSASVQEEIDDYSQQWEEAEISISNLSIVTKCKSPIPFDKMDKYQATLLALRDGTLQPRYKRLIEY